MSGPPYVIARGLKSARTCREQLQYGGPLDRVADFRGNLRNQRVANLLPQ
jgi:hypothetical protein